MEVMAIFKTLETFRVVYEIKSFSKAAEILFVSQPTVSAQIKQLENELNTQLFIRNGRADIVVTPQADLLYEKAVKMLEDWDRLHTDVQNQGQRSYKCVIGASHTFAVHLLPKLLMALYHRLPNVRFTVKMMNSMQVLNALESHHIDLGIVEKPLSAQNIQRHTLMDDQLVLAGNWKAGPWLVREPSSGVYYYTKRYLEEEDIQIPKMEIQNNEIIIELLRQGFGCSIVSSLAAKGMEHIELDESFKRNFFLMARNPVAYEALEDCIKFICDWSKAYQK